MSSTLKEHTSVEKKMSEGCIRRAHFAETGIFVYVARENVFDARDWNDVHKELSDQIAN